MIENKNESLIEQKNNINSLEQQFTYQIKELAKNNNRRLIKTEEGINLRIETMKDNLHKTITDSIEFSPLKSNFVEKNEIDKLAIESSKADDILEKFRN
jgi:hypothetical protein